MTEPSAVVPFKYADGTVRTSEQDGAAWFALPDVCKVLGHTNPTRAASRLDPDEVMQARIQTLGGMQTVAMVSESGMYSLVLTSRVPGAKKFKRWITREVLPSIRRTGQYLTDEARSVYTDRRRTMAYDVRDLFRLADKHPAAAADIRRIARDINDTALYGWMESLAAPDSNRQIREIAPPNV